MKTQLACLESGAPVEIMFQSLAGTDRTLIEEFDVHGGRARPSLYVTMAKHGPLAGEAAQFMYFEKVKMQRPEVLIAYVRQQNKRGDTRHPMRRLSSENA